MANILNQEWLNENSNRNYPFREDVSLLANDVSEVRLPNFLIVDFIITVAGTPLDVYLDTVLYAGTFINLVFKDSADIVVTNITINTATHVAYTAYDIVGVGDNYDDARGKIVVGELSQIASYLPQGAYTFSLENAKLESCTIRPDIRGIRSLVVQSGGIDSEIITGKVKLIAGTNCSIVYDAADNSIRIDAVNIPGSGFNQPCECEDNLVPECIRKINGVNIEDLQIIGDGKCVDVSTNGNVITISDKCSAPCCGCVELEFLTNSLGMLENNLGRLEGYSDLLNSKLDEFINSALLSV
ncbi:hypothetical protein ACFLQL_00285 [Verrucomicrobiota bacterium]